MLLTRRDLKCVSLFFHYRKLAKKDNLCYCLCCWLTYEVAILRVGRIHVNLYKHEDCHGLIFVRLEPANLSSEYSRGYSPGMSAGNSDY